MWVDRCIGCRLGLAGLALAAWTPSVADAAPGEIVPIGIGTNGSNYGYWEYLPAEYSEDQLWPVLVFLTGIGEVGTGQVNPNGCGWPAINPDFSGNGDLCNALRHGPPALIYRALNNDEPWMWDTEARPMIVIAPQNPIVNDAYDVEELDSFFDYLSDQYSVDPRRFYLMGMSQGGRTIPLYMLHNPHRLAVAVPISGYAEVPTVMAACDFTQQAFWAFHGEFDSLFAPGSITSLRDAIAVCPAPRPDPLVTLFASAGHDVWTPATDPGYGMTRPIVAGYDPYNVDIYQYILTHDKPVVDAGPDLTIGPTSSTFHISAMAIDDDTLTWHWTQTSGAPLTLSHANTPTLDVSDLLTGEYDFEVLIVDSDGQWDRDEIHASVTTAMSATSSGTTGSDASTGGGTSSSGGASVGTTSTATSAGSEGSSDDGTDSDPNLSTGTSGVADGSGSTTHRNPNDTAGVHADTSLDGASDEPTQDGGTTGCSCRTGSAPPVEMLALSLVGLCFVPRRSRFNPRDARQ